MDEAAYGPLQLLVIVFGNPNSHGQIQRELESVMDRGMIRFIDLLFIWKDKKGKIRSMETTQLDKEEKMSFGAFVGGLIGYGAGGEEGAREGKEAGTFAAARENYGITEEDILEIAEAVPEGTAAAVLIIEHLWAKKLKEAVRDGGGILVSQRVLKPESLISVGEELAEEIKFAGKKKKGFRAGSAV